MQIWIYHKTEKPKVIEVSDLKKFEEFEWSDDPSKFVDLVAQFGIDLEADDAGVLIQQVGESIQGIRGYLNGLLNLAIMPGKELRAFGKEHFDLKMTGKTLKAMRLKIQEAITVKENALSQ